jgi:hypothetical protein
MNNASRKAQDLSKPNAQANQWYSTYVREIYLFLAIKIYITLFLINKVADY